MRYVQDHGPYEILGFEEGWICGRARAAGIPVLDVASLSAKSGSFDVVTAVEVIEHVARPLEMLSRIRLLLKPGGLLFLTTGNAEPFRTQLASWRYVIPEIHVSFFEPDTLARCLERAGFRPQFPGFLPGFAEIIHFKALKNLRRRKRSALERTLLWGLLARLFDSRLRFSAHSVGWAR